MLRSTSTRSATRPKLWWTISTNRSPERVGFDGKARAMVVTNGVENAIRYFHAIRDYLEERKSPV